MQAQASLLGFLKEIEKLYSNIDLFMLNLEKRLRLVIASEINPLQAFEILRKENAWWKNKKRSENFYFAPSRKQKSFSWLFLDDVDISKLQGYEAIIVQTSSNKHQAYIRLAKEAEAKEYKKIAKGGVKLFHADKAVVDEYHLRRLPSFLNTKYSPPFLIKWYRQSGKALEIQAHRPPQWRKVLIPPKGGVCLNRKTWNEFYSPSAPSYSEVDFAYACYLLKLGYEPEEVKNILRQESPELAKRHRDPEDYLDRTVKAALENV